MDVLVDPTFSIDVSSPPPAHGGELTSGEVEERGLPIPACLLLREIDGCPKNGGSGYAPPNFIAGESSESSSSIGTPDGSDNDLSLARDGDSGEEEEVQSKLSGVAGLSSLDPLEDALPIKRGLSSHFDGKSKSFTDLSQVTIVSELKKQENPFNKRRRVLIASKWSKKSAFYSWSNPKSMPLLPVDEDDDVDYEQEKARKSPSPLSPSSSSSTEDKKPEDRVELQHKLQNKVSESYTARMRLRLGSFKSRSFSLADLQEHGDQEEEEEDED